MYTPCPCFSCGKQISYIQDIGLAVDGAIDITIYGGYGSMFDLAIMKIWICDDCIEERMEERVVMVIEDVTDDYTLGECNE